MTRAENLHAVDLEQTTLFSFDTTIKKILLPNGAGVEVSEMGRQVFPGFIDAIKKSTENGGQAAVAVIRCWGKDTKLLGELAYRIQTIKNNFPALVGVVLAINHDQDKNDMTEANLELLSQQREFAVPILPVKIKGYTWTSGLNSGIALVNEIAIEKGIDRENIRMLNMSFDVEIEDVELQKMARLAGEQRYIFTVRKTGEGELPFKTDLIETRKKLKGLIKKPLQSQVQLLELVYAMRNTLNLIPLSKLIELGGYNPLCNGKEIKTVDGTRFSIMGMEDIEFFARAIQKDLQKGNFNVFKQLRIPMANPIVYTDPSWKRLKELSLIMKAGNERNALIQIFSDMARLDGNIVPVESQDFRIRN
ncbi:MAG: hypothetical protein Q8P53_03240 [Candidatus Shapirobacteria bacterium]|nr:hypothetical protein [Candidatus Shapirobacteria bacterium]